MLDPATWTICPRSPPWFSVGLDRTSGARCDVYVIGLASVTRTHSPSNRLIYVSSTSVCGQTDGSEVDETAATEPLDESGRIVLEAERLLRRERPDAIVCDSPASTARADCCDEPHWRPRTDRGRPRGVAESDPRGRRGCCVLAAEKCGSRGGLYNVGDGHPVRAAIFTANLPGCWARPDVCSGIGQSQSAVSAAVCATNWP